MIETIFGFESTRIRQRQAPLLKERECFLAHLHGQGVTIGRLRSVASMLIHIIRLMKLGSLRMVALSEVKDAALQWTSDPHQIKRGRKSPESFTALAVRWFRFADLISPLATAKTQNDMLIEDFRHYLESVRALSTETIRTHHTRVTRFMRWMSMRQTSLAKISISDIDDYLKSCRDIGFRPRTIASICSALREFFRYAELRHLNDAKVARNISSPRISKYDMKPKGPEWRDVRRLLDHGFGSTPAELRAAALLSLCSIYAIRSCEVVVLTLDDFDWVAETLTLRRAKSGRIQQFPLQFEVGETILRYLQKGRPRCSCRRLFVTLKPPFRPMRACSTWHIVSAHMKDLRIESENYGVHSLRHSCATQLLRKGSSLRDIADFLGHSDMKSVSIYAKYDSRTLKQVAAFSLAGLK